MIPNLSARHHLPTFALFLLITIGVPAGSARASDPIDLLVVYTPRTVTEHFGGSVSDFEQAIQDELLIMNETFVNSHLPDDFRYELVGVEPICFEERGNIRLDLQWVMANPEVAALREATGADFVLLISGTSSYGGMARWIFSSSPSQRTEAFAVVEAFGLGTLTVGHELGHVLGCGHNPEVLILPDNPGPNHGFLHWESEPYFRTQMSYHYFPGVNCQPCKENQLNAFSSPDLWYMFDGNGGLLNQTCWPNNLGDGSYELDCPDGTTTTLSDTDLAAQGIPMGTEISNNRLQVLERWDIAAAYFARPLAQGCTEDCASLKRVGCTSNGATCGGCLPGFGMGPDGCYPVVPAQTGVPLVDGCFSDAGAVATDDGIPTSFLVDLGQPYQLARVDLHLSTYDAAGSSDWSWTPASFMPWNAPSPPAYTYELEASIDGQNFVSLASGTENTPEGSVYGNENGHTMMRQAWSAASVSDLEEARWIRVQVTGCGESDCAPQIGLHEIRAFGDAMVDPDEITAKVFRILDDPEIPGNAKKRRFVFVSKGEAGGPGSATMPAWDSANDPTLAGAQLELYRTGGSSGDTAIFDLPASGWKKIGKPTRPGYRYKDGKGDHGGIRKVVLRSGLLKVVGQGNDMYRLDAAPQSEMAMRLSLGNDKILCATAAARSPEIKFDSSVRFFGIKNAPAPTTCPALP